MKYKNIINFIYDLTNKGIKIYVLNENIKLKIPENISFSQEDKVFITQNKHANIYYFVGTGYFEIVKKGHINFSS